MKSFECDDIKIVIVFISGRAHDGGEGRRLVVRRVAQAPALQITCKNNDQLGQSGAIVAPKWHLSLPKISWVIMTKALNACQAQSMDTILLLTVEFRGNFISLSF